MIIVMGQYRLAADHVEALRPHLKKVLAGSRAEPGCLLYTLAEAVDDPGLIRVAEKWRSQGDLDAHFLQPHMAEWRAAAAAAGGIGERDIAVYEVAAERKL